MGTLNWTLQFLVFSETTVLKSVIVIAVKRKLGIPYDKWSIWMNHIWTVYRECIVKKWFSQLFAALCNLSNLLQRSLKKYLFNKLLLIFLVSVLWPPWMFSTTLIWRLLQNWTFKNVFLFIPSYFSCLLCVIPRSENFLYISIKTIDFQFNESWLIFYKN